MTILNLALLFPLLTAHWTERTRRRTRRNISFKAFQVVAANKEGNRITAKFSLVLYSGAKIKRAVVNGVEGISHGHGRTGRDVS